MKFLLDVSALIALLVRVHADHAKTSAFLRGNQLVVCPLVELGFLRILTNERIHWHCSMSQARTFLETFLALPHVSRIDDDLPALQSRPSNSSEVTDHYLADLASKHQLRLVTLDSRMRHPAADLIV